MVIYSKVKKFILGSLIIFTVGSLCTALCANSIFSIIPSLPKIHVRLGELVSDLPFTVTNISEYELQNITAPYNSYKMNNISASVTSTNCLGTLLNNQSCLINLRILATSLGSATLEPVVCAFSGSVCSYGKLTVLVDNQPQSPVSGVIGSSLPGNTMIGATYPLVVIFTNMDTKYPATGIKVITALPDSMITKNTCNGILNPLASCEVSFLFTPTEEKTYSLSGSFLYDQGDIITISASTATSRVAVSGQMIQPLPSNIEKDRSYPVAFQFTNFSNFNATGATFTVPSELTITSNTCTTLPNQILAAKQSCTIEGVFTSGKIGLVSLSTVFSSPTQANSVTLTTSSQVSDVVIQGTINPDLPSNITPGMSYPVVFTFTNSGSLPATDIQISKITPNFSESNDTCTTELAPGASCMVSGSYQTSVVGPASISIIMHYAEENVPLTLTSTTIVTQAAIVGSLVPPLPSNVEENREYPIIFYYKNTGRAQATNLSFIDNLPGFIPDAPSPDTCGTTLLANRGCKVSGVFKASLIPQTSGPVSLSKTLTYDQSPQTVVLTSNSTVTDVSITGSVTGLPADTNTDADYSVQFTFTNNSIANATGIKTIQSLPYVSSITDNCNATLNAGSSCSITGTFNSAHIGPETLNISLLYNEGDTVSVNSVTNVLGAPYIYVTNTGSNKILRCDVNKITGALSNCINSGASRLDRPDTIVMSNKYAYINNISGSNDWVICNIEQSVLFGCVGILGPRGNSRGLALDTLNNRIYIAEYSNNSVFVCDIDSFNGRPVNCKNTNATTLNGAHGIAFSQNNNYVYIANEKTRNVTMCFVNPVDGTFSNCAIVSTLGGVGVYTNSSKTRLYISNGSANISVCPIHTANGTLGTCITAGNSVSGVNGIGFNQNDTRGYIVNISANTISICTINSQNGTFTDCRDSDGTGFSSPRRIFLRNVF